jgi:anti-anti-sigma factor
MSIEPAERPGIEYDLPSCRVDVARKGTTMIVAVEGEIDIASVSLLRSAVARADREVDVLVIDLTEVSFLESAGIQALLRAEAVAEDIAARLVVVVALGGAPEQVLELAGLQARLTVVHDH